MSYTPDHSRIFVFGSNLSGFHGAGAAAFALVHHGAMPGMGFGRQGNSFAIPTKDFHVRPLDLKTIDMFVQLFIQYANNHPELRFQVTRVGCGLAGYTDEEIAPMFRAAPSNCDLPEGWRT